MIHGCQKAILGL